MFSPTPTLIYPDKQLVKPNVAFDTQSFNVPCQCGGESGAEAVKRLNDVQLPKAIVIFVGGFCDTIMCAVYREFLAFNTPHCLKAYVSFSCRKLLISWLPSLMQHSLPLVVVAHSWGARNAYWALNTIESARIEYFLSLDSVGYKTPKNHPQSVAFWENVYITNKAKFLHQANVLALVGHSWDSVKWADQNISLSAPATHASVRQMIQASSLSATLDKIIKP